MSEAGFPSRVIRCPRCGGPSLYASANPSRPFCSPRCKANDFGAWASEAYRVEKPLDPEDDEAENRAAAPEDPRD